MSEARDRLAEQREACLAYLQSGKACLVTLTPISEDASSLVLAGTVNFIHAPESSLNDLVYGMAMHEWLVSDMRERFLSLVGSECEGGRSAMERVIDDVVAQLAARQPMHVSGHARRHPPAAGEGGAQ